MKYLLGIAALLVISKFALSNPQAVTYLNDYKELLMAAALTLASRPLLKRIFE
ncbi:hypothetical protein [Kangiella sp. HZ709]|uniref:hypothetical protein n=1 Tax=Kangiella sp. HZ709 TaxID=2666328 RepID=UPI0018A1EC41|nr:hypothetical protein [Kangiella sp. HZ709]